MSSRSSKGLHDGIRDNPEECSGPREVLFQSFICFAFRLHLHLCMDQKTSAFGMKTLHLAASKGDHHFVAVTQVVFGGAHTAYRTGQMAIIGDVQITVLGVGNMDGTLTVEGGNGHHSFVLQNFNEFIGDHGFEIYFFHTKIRIFGQYG